MQDSTKNKKGRGRPRAYDRDIALDAITKLFWRQGYSATSLDDLAASTSMNRPSLYQAFGSKADMYQHAFNHFAQNMSSVVRSELQKTTDVQEGLINFYDNVLEIYYEESSEMGCFVFCTTVAEVLNHSELRSAVHAVIDRIEAALEQYLRVAQQAGYLHKDTDINALATMAQALLQHLAIRARAGDSKASLKQRARQSVSALLRGHLLL